MMRLIFSVSMVLSSIAFGYAQSAKVVSAFNYLRDGSFDEAEAAINEAIQDPKTGAQAKTWFYRGAIYEAIYGDTSFRKKNPEAITEAIKSYQKAMEIEPKNQWKEDIQLSLGKLSEYTFNEGVTPYNMKDYQAAYDHFIESANTYKYLNTTFNLGLVDTFATLYAAQAAGKLKKYDDARVLYESLLRQNIHRPEIYSNLADIHMQSGDTATAKEIVASGTEMYPGDKQLMVQELNLYLFSGDEQGAIDKLKAAIKKDPGFTELYVQLGGMYDQIKDTSQSRLAYEQALKIDQNSFDANYRLGASYYNKAVDLNNQMNKLDLNQQKQYDQLKVQRDALFKKALPFLEKAYELSPKDRDTLGALRELYARLGQMEKSNEMKNQIEALK